jgi:hypothetical protein
LRNQDGSWQQFITTLQGCGGKCNARANNCRRSRRKSTHTNWLLLRWSSDVRCNSSLPNALRLTRAGVSVREIQINLRLQRTRQDNGKCRRLQGRRPRRPKSFPAARVEMIVAGRPMDQSCFQQVEWRTGGSICGDNTGPIDY